MYIEHQRQQRQRERDITSCAGMNTIHIHIYRRTRVLFAAPDRSTAAWTHVAARPPPPVGRAAAVYQLYNKPARVIGHITRGPDRLALLYMITYIYIYADKCACALRLQHLKYSRGAALLSCAHSPQPPFRCTAPYSVYKRRLRIRMTLKGRKKNKKVARSFFINSFAVVYSLSFSLTR